MLKPLIQLNDFSGAMSLNDKIAAKNQVAIGYGMNPTLRRGYLTMRPGFVRMTLSSSSDIGVEFQDMLYAIEDGVLYFAGEDTKIYKSTGNLVVEHDSANSGAIRSLKEYNGYMYYAQETIIGRSSLAGTPVYEDTWLTTVVSGGAAMENKTFHPMEVSGDNNMYIGNGQYVDRYNGSGDAYSSHALDLASGWDIQCLANFGVLYLAIGANFGTTSCKIFLWDRFAPSWNDEIEIPETKIFAMISRPGGLWVFAGSSTASIYYIPLNSRQATRVYTFENDNEALYTYTIYPNAVTYKNGRVYFGLSANTAISTQVYPAVYSFNPNPENLQMNIEFYNPSASGLVDFKSVRVVNYDTYRSVLYISYENGSTQNLVRENLLGEVDVYASWFSPAGTIETVYYEAPPDKKLYFDGFGIDTLPRTTGSITLEYKADGDTSWTTIKSSYQDALGTGFYITKAVECKSIKFRISVDIQTGSSLWFIKRLFATGQLIDDTR